MKVLFTGFAIFMPIGFILLIAGAPFSLGLITIAAGILLGLSCAFSPCPCCAKRSGVFTTPLVSGVFPMGFCFHCGKSYLGKGGC